MARTLRIALTIGLIFCLFVYVAGTLASLATNEALMARRFEQHTDAAVTGVEPANLPQIAHAITGFLGGTLHTPQVALQRQGQVVNAFADHEIAHLKDIRALVSLSKVLRWVAIGLLVLTLAGYLQLKKARPGILRQVRPSIAIRLAAMLFLLLLLGLAVWGFFAFDSLFIAFHRVFFRNDLWLLDEKTDLLLQLMPRGFFTSYALDLLKQNAFLLLILPLAAFGLREHREASHGH